MSVSLYQRRKWLRRAETLLRKADDLHYEMVRALGEDHEATDYSDNAAEECRQLADVLGKDTLHIWHRASPKLSREE